MCTHSYLHLQKEGRKEEEGEEKERKTETPALRQLKETHKGSTVMLRGLLALKTVQSCIHALLCIVLVDHAQLSQRLRKLKIRV